ncbi:MAG: DNA repair protein RecO [Woeseiaceae bacterium]|nr:DNA repair protein RecO [Woeseiaceae bacterium]
MSKRVQQQAAWILHHRPFRDTSQILDILTRDHGRIAVVARGSRGSKSKLAGVLRPFLPLRVSWVARTDLGTLTGAEAAGAPTTMRGDALLSAYYVNELLLNFLLRHDPQPEIFELYGEAVRTLAASDSVAACLRSFELELLSLLGYAVNLEHAAASHEDVDPDRHYDYRIEQGPVPVQRSDGPLVFRGATLRAIAAQEFADADVLRAAGRLLRQVIAHHLGGRELQSRKVLLEVHRGRIAG